MSSLYFSSLVPMTHITLNNGIKMPVLGLGTFQSEPDQVVRAVEIAIDAGYRHIDTAFLYCNEKEIGMAVNNKINEGVLKREDIFITSKVLQ
ncbi:unnamed protein product [Protopolystoma xenopodis]|uniref:NADP-dependent oxidoreductase domain-containing protein n=1 Tax=Protopolystoma xenopodis TaxID=117903 RepID=A0A3S5FH42_9PLAT|nr:unnamed protein product [Protopolystoma xenopodis]VEL42125.1 unnamed protein product [Protopolystoma xenopodis]